ncbi:hypothetical protein ABK040_009823 [Willaertia magna]
MSFNFKPLKPTGGNHVNGLSKPQEMWKRGTMVFFDHPKESWICGSIVDIEWKKIVNKRNCPYLCKPLDNSIEEAWVEEKSLYLYKKELDEAKNDDLLDMIELHESSLLRCVSNRHKDDLIYTYIGNLVLSLNPFKWSIFYCQDDFMIQYMEQKKGLVPHCWQIADSAYRSLKNGEGNHSIIISGESGAGKTEACKSVIKYICRLSSSMTNVPTVKKSAELISVKIQESSPILEAFGNAKTKNNDNSSRFGKFIRLQFDKQGIIVGASTENYLLEKSRLIRQGPGERSYHIFYQMFAGLDAKKKKELKLTNPEDFCCIMGGNCVVIEGVDDKREFEHTVKAMNTVGISEKEIDTIFQVCASILHLENVKFVASDTGTTVENMESLQIAAELLQIDAVALLKALTTKVYSISNKVFESPVTPDQASDSRDALSKGIYSKMFDWIVNRINKTTSQQSYAYFIGLLDIFGFEKFEFNTFEQFCINFANETLQYHYNSYTFKKDQAECEQDGIDVTLVKFRDNQRCLDMIKDGNGILGTLDVQSALVQGTDQQFVENVTKACKENREFSPYFISNPLKKEDFTVVHYAGEVSYNTKNWIEKNRDILKDDIIDVLQRSKISLVAKDFCPEKKDFTPKKEKKPTTVSGGFRKQLSDLLDVINSTTPHWIRTIKPHPEKKAGMFSNFEVMKQLRSSGVLETVRIRREGYPVRIPHKLFFNRYKIIINENVTSNYKESCEKIIAAVNFNKDKAQVGKEKIFLRAFASNEIEVLKTKILEKYTLLCQKYVRGFLGRRRVKHIKEENKRKREREEYERNKEIFDRMDSDRKERERMEQEKRECEEKEKREKEEKERVEKERIERIKFEKERLEREKRETEEKEKQKLEILKAKKKERELQLVKIEQDIANREKKEKQQIEMERKRQEEERERIMKEDIEKRLQSIMEKEEQRKIEERQQKIRARRDIIAERKKEREKVEMEAEKRKQRALEALNYEKQTRKQQEEEVVKLAEIARTKFEEDMQSWEERELEKMVRDLMLDEQKRENKTGNFKEKTKRVSENQQLLNQITMEMSLNLHERSKRAQAKKASLELAKEENLQLKKSQHEIVKRKLLQKKQEEEIQKIEKKAQLQWEIDKEKRKAELRKLLREKLENEKVKEAWKELERQKSEEEQKQKVQKKIWELECQLSEEAQELEKQREEGKIKKQSQLQREQALSVKEKQDFNEQLSKLTKKIGGVFTSTDTRNKTNSLISKSTSLSNLTATLSSPRSERTLPMGDLSKSLSITNTSLSSPMVLNTPTSLNRLKRQTQPVSPISPRLPIKKGSFSKLY